MLNIKDLVEKFSNKVAAKRVIKDACKIMDDESKTAIQRLQAQVDMLAAESYLATVNQDSFDSEMLIASIELLTELKKAERLAREESQRAYSQSMKTSYNKLPLHITEKMDVEIMEDGEWDFPIG